MIAQWKEKEFQKNMEQEGGPAGLRIHELELYLPNDPNGLKM